MENKDLKFIKKNYGERFMHLCRTLFPSILEHEGLLPKLISDNFAPTRSLYDAITKENKQSLFKNFIMSQADFDEEFKKANTKKTPKELLSEAGYILYPECKKEKDIQYFKKYYQENEQICTFMGGRLELCRVWFAVRKDVDQIRREDFKEPHREDRYGTSVISIQFSRDGNWLSIKNRYNHTVHNPDCTFGNNLDNIIQGLTDSFCRTYNLDIKQRQFDCFDLNNFIKAEDGRRYKINIDYYGDYCCENNNFVHLGEVTHFDRNKFLLMDNYLVDFQHKTISLYDYSIEKFVVDRKSAFTKSIGRIKNIAIKKNADDSKTVTFVAEDDTVTVVTLDNKNCIIAYENNSIEYIDDGFLKENINLKILKMPNAIVIGDSFLENNTSLEDVELPKVKQIGNNFLSENCKIKTLSMDSLKEVGNGFCESLKNLPSVYLPSLETVGASFLYFNKTLKHIDLPKLQSVDKNFLFFNENLKELDLPNLVDIGDDFMCKNKVLEKINIPKAKFVGRNFLYDNNCMESIELISAVNIDGLLGKNEVLTHISVPNVETIGDDFLRKNIALKSIELPKIKKIGNFFLANNTNISNIDIKTVEEIGDGFLCNNYAITKLDLPNVDTIGNYFLMLNKDINTINLPKLRIIGSSFLIQNQQLNEVNLPNVNVIGNNFLAENKKATSVFMPNIRRIGKQFMDKNKKIKKMYALSVASEKLTF